MLNGRLTFDLMVRSERLAVAAAILRISGLLLDFMISAKENDPVVTRELISDTAAALIKLF